MQDILKEVLLDHVKSPKNKKELDNPDLSGHSNNPVCGDVVKVDLQIDNDTVVDVSISGQGCAVSQASMSIFGEEIKGSSLKDVKKKIEQFRKREALEIKNLEKFVLKQERENYEEVQERIEKIKFKYQAIRDQKIRERIEQLGIEVSDEDTRSDLLEKERQFNLDREKIENNLESFYRSMASCIFQLNRRWLPKKMSLLRVIDRRYETSEIFIKLDEENDENWIMLVYLKDNDPSSNIVVEDKTNPVKNHSNEYKPNEIFKFSDALVDSLTSMIDREYKKKLN
mgnify:CR=1 FL=1